MIFAIEGPDQSGKSTLFQMLKPMFPSAVFVPRLPMTSGLLAVADEMDTRLLALWEHLYDPEKMYICDRHSAVSGPVYGALYRRPAIDVSTWYDRVYVIYLEVALEELRRRNSTLKDDLFDAKHFAELKGLYYRYIDRFRTAHFSGSMEPDYLRQVVASHIRHVIETRKKSPEG